jgi:hypothetical protein
MHNNIAHYKLASLLDGLSAPKLMRGEVRVNEVEKEL